MFTSLQKIFEKTNSSINVEFIKQLLFSNVTQAIELALMLTYKVFLHYGLIQKKKMDQVPLIKFEMDNV